MQEEITLSDQATIRLEVKAGLNVVRERGGAAESVVLPYPGAGYGGHGFVVSARENYLALHLYSGQSEEGYELFSLTPTLRHLGGLPYVGGLGASLVFSVDEQWVAFALATDPGFCTEDELQPGSTMPWVEVRVQGLPNGGLTLCEVAVEVPAGCEPTEEMRFPHIREFPSSARLVLSGPWGAELVLSLPLPRSASLPYFD